MNDESINNLIAIGTFLTLALLVAAGLVLRFGP